MRMPSFTVISSCLSDGTAERRLQIAAMDHPIRRAVALRGSLAERHAHDFASGLGVEHAQARRRDHVRPQPVFQPEIDQRARGVGRELDAGAGFLEPLGLLQHDDAKTVARERQRRGQPADAGPGDNDDTRRRQDLLLRRAAQTAVSCKAHSAGRAASGASVGSWR